MTGQLLEIRRAQAGEHAGIDELLRAAYAHDYGPSGSAGDPMHRADVRARAHDVWVAIDSDGLFVGSVTTRRPGGPSLHEDVAETELDLRLLGVSPLARRRGIGAAIMRHIEDVARDAGWSAVTLKTAPNMSGAHRLYEALGFSRTPERDGLWIGGERVLDLFNYVLPLSAGVEPPLAIRDADIASDLHARSVLGAFPSGVVAVTAVGAEGERVGLVVQSFLSLSLSPLRIVLSIGATSSSWLKIAERGNFAVTALGAGQGETARQLARPSRDKFAGLATTPSRELGYPLILGGVAWLECSVHEVHQVGDNLLVTANVLGLGHLPSPAGPLVFAGSRFARLA